MRRARREEYPSRTRESGHQFGRPAAQFAVKIRRRFVLRGPRKIEDFVGLSIECTSKRTRVFVLSFPLFRLSRSDNLPRRRFLRTRRKARLLCAANSTVRRAPGDVAQLGEHLLCKQ